LVHDDLPVEHGEVDDRRDEAVVERAQALHGLALHRLGGDDLDPLSPSSSLSRRPLPISVPPVPRPATKALTSSSSSRISSAVPL